MKLYGLRLIEDKTKVAHFSVSSFSVDEDNCTDTEFNLDFEEFRIDKWDDPLWLVPVKEVAEMAKTGTAWYNSCHRTPSHSKKPEELEVYEIEVTFPN